MRRFLGLLIYFIVLGWSSSTQGQDAARERIRERASEMVFYFRVEQDDKFVDLVYPKMIELAGGRDKMLALLKNAEGDIRKSGIKLDSVQLGDPTMPVVAGDKQYSVVPETLLMTGPKVTITSISYLIAISTDDGKTWTFVDGSGVTPESLKIILPDFPPEIKLPEKKKPKITRLP